jgi:DNA-binding MarR family transcriptional regulator
MLKAALWYAKRGVYVFPLHNPIFNDRGDCMGCTCEDWKRKQPRYGANFKCDQPGKCPRVKWADKSTTDAEQIRQWWGWWPDANIGIDCGKSSIIALDRDSYKNTYAGDDLHIDTLTVTAITGGGGQHLYFRMPTDKQYGNATGKLPKGIDVRGAGGYVVAAPSLHRSGRRYAYAPGQSFADIELAPLPQSLIDVLDAAQTPQAAPVIFTGGPIPTPDLARWDLSSDIVTLIEHGAPKGQRSEADYRVILALVAVGATDDDIRATFTHFSIGEKYGEKGDKYLSLSIANARARAIERPQATKEQFETARRNIHAPHFVETLRASGIKRVAGPIACLHSLLKVATPRRTTKFKITMRDLADMYSASRSTACRHIKQLAEVGKIIAEQIDGCTVIDLSNLLDLDGTVQRECVVVPSRSTSDDAFFDDHVGDDAFTNYPYTYAIKRRKCPTALMQSLGANALLLWAALAAGGTVKELAEATGLTVATVRATLKRFIRAGLVMVAQWGRAKEYWLCSDAEKMLEEKREHMVTDGMGQMRVGRNADENASYAHRQLRGNATLEPGKRAWLENRCAAEDAKGEAVRASLLRRGIDPSAKVRERGDTNTIVEEDLSELSLADLVKADPDKTRRAPRPNTLRIDAVEEWRSWGRDTWETLQCFGDMDLSEKIRLWTVAEVGEEASVETYRNTRREIAERVELALSLAPRRATLERAYTHPDAQEDVPLAPTMPTSLFAMPHIYA